jgi:hypothetical protein
MRLTMLVAVAVACKADEHETNGGPTISESEIDTATTIDPPETETEPQETEPETETESETGADPELALTAVDPTIADPLGASRLTLTGVGFLAGGPVDRVTLGGVEAAAIEVRSDRELVVTSPPLDLSDRVDVVVYRGGSEAELLGAVEVWSPAQLDGARLFDAASGVVGEGAATSYEWQRLTAEVAPDWRARDGNTTTWLPSTGRYWMVGGWNPYPAVDGGFDTVTTDEVWSSPDGVTWTSELPHLHGAFERRHAHNTVVWNDRLWMVGGDTWQGYLKGLPYYNHDVVSSADGVNWTVELGPGAASEPPWSERALQTIGVYDGRLWMAGGQDLLGDPAEYTYHNDVWVTDDGVAWSQVVADAPASDTRWAGCGILDGLVAFRERLWLVGCARYNESTGSTMSNEVWSTTDGATWTRHADPPWVGKIWHNVVVWDGKLWALFGYTYGDPENGWPAGNANEAWFSEDGEAWQSLPPDMPVPGSHAQGVAVRDDSMLLAGGNHSFGFGAGEDHSVWRLVPFHGDAVRSWTDRGDAGLTVAAESDDARPVRVIDAFGPGSVGLQFDGSRSLLVLAEANGDVQDAGRSVFWVARAPYLPSPWGWEDTYAPVATVVGGPVANGLPVASVGYTEGALVLRNLNDALGAWGESVYGRFAVGSGLQEGPGEVRLAGVTHAVDGAVAGWVDGALAGEGAADYGTPRAWTSIGGGLEDGYYGPNTRFSGTIGAVLVLPWVADEATVARVHAWARGRFGAE